MAAVRGSAGTSSAKKAAPAKKSAAKKAATPPKAAAKKAVKKTPPAKAPAAKSPAKKTQATKSAAGKIPAAKTPAAKTPAAKTPAKKSPAKTAPAAKTAGTSAPAAKKAAPPVPRGSEWTAAELRAVRAQLVEQLNKMSLAYDRSMSDLNDLQRAGTDGAGDDQADTGNKTFEREQEQSIAANRYDLLVQIRRAVERIDAGTYGFCERCGKPIPKARLKAFPSATLDVACKQREERR